MRTFDVDILMIPGLTGSGSDHWQTRWERRLQTARRVEQNDWLHVDRDAWVGRVHAAVLRATRPVMLVAHSCGVPTVVHTARQLTDTKVIGAFLVAPPAERTAAASPAMVSLAPYPTDPPPFPSLLVASRNDPYCSYDEAGELALNWGSTLVDAGDVGHLNTASGHGPWPEGAMRFGWFLKQLGVKGPAS
jgi:predicted alpha/beta hydrolase family esterase